jgi:hypothetical protein
MQESKPVLILSPADIPGLLTDWSKAPKAWALQWTDINTGELLRVDLAPEAKLEAES